MPAFLRDTSAVIEANYPGFKVAWFGHIGDGNLHLNILRPENLGKGEFFTKCATINKWAFEIIEKYNSPISAGHSVGTTKRSYLAYARSGTGIAYMEVLETMFDPNGIMNPDKVFAE